MLKVCVLNDGSCAKFNYTLMLLNLILFLIYSVFHLIKIASKINLECMSVSCNVFFGIRIAFFFLSLKEESSFDKDAINECHLLCIKQTALLRSLR